MDYAGSPAEAGAGRCRPVQAGAGGCRLVQAGAGGCRRVQAGAGGWRAERDEGYVKNTAKALLTTKYSCITKKYSYICGMKKETIKLTAKEEEIMELFWERGPMFIRELQDLYDEPKPHFNTLSTIVRGLEEKGMIAHKAFGKTFQYYAAMDKAVFSEHSLKNVIGKYFGSSPFSAVSALVRNEDISEEELESLLEIIRKKGK